MKKEDLLNQNQKSERSRFRRRKILFQKKNFREFRVRALERYDGALITPGPNLYYLTGLDPKNVLERLFIFILDSEGKITLIAPEIYRQETDASWIDDIFFWDDEKDPYEKFKRTLKSIDKKTSKILVEDSMDSSILMKVQKQIKKFELVPLSSETSSMREMKAEKELDYMEKAAGIVDKVFEELIKKDLIGKTEKEIASWIEYKMKQKGSEGSAFATIVASGPNSSNPHHSPSNREIKAGDMVIFDYGAKYNGYCSDITRTVAVDEVPKKAEKIYEIVKKAERNAWETVEEGIKAKEIDLAARDFIEKHDYGEYFTHRVGHGLGLQAHEKPYITAGNEGKIKKGMTFTVEPGIYIEGKFGIRIEDDIIVKDETERMTQSDRDLKII